MAEVDVLVDVGLVPIDQLVPVTLGAVQQGAEPSDEGSPSFGMGAAEQLLGFLPRPVQPVQGRADGFAAAQAAKPRLHKADQPLQRSAGFRVGAGDGRRSCFLLGCPDLCFTPRGEAQARVPQAAPCRIGTLTNPNTPSLVAFLLTRL